VEPVEEPKKERERFRDKMKRGLKLKSSKTSSPILERVEATKEITEEEFFGSNLETVEKDFELKRVPKMVFDCVQILEDSANLSTPGIYRVSGKSLNCKKNQI
jgi:hypothetical protein